MNKKILIFLSFLMFQVTTIPTFAAIGDWKAYLAYHDVQEIEQAGNLLFIKASNDLYVYNQNDQSIQTFSKADYLNDCKIQHIAYNKTAKRLLIIYSNFNIDLMNVSNFEVTNLSDYYTASTTGDKTINDIYMYSKYAYVSNGFGILKLNMTDIEITDTYNLGFPVNWCEIEGNTIYAYSSAKGKYSASLSSNLLDKNNWKKVGNYVAKAQEDKSELKQLVSTLNPGGPKYNYFGFLKYANNQLYTCNGNVGGQKDACIQILGKDNWNIYQDDNISNITGVGYKDLVCIDYDPLDIKHVFAGGRNGLYEFYDGKFVKHYNHTNSLIEIVGGLQNNAEYELVQGIKYDASGNLWLLNSEAPNSSLIEYSKDQEWISRSKSELMKYESYGVKNKSLATLQSMMIDSRGLLWFVNNHWANPSFFCYQFPTNNTDDGVIKAFTSITNQDGTTISNIFGISCIAEDKNKNLWIGTNQGPFLLESNQITADSPVFTQVKVPRNDGTNYADYLLTGMNISCIAIDKANRKWFGTKNNGVYLISSDNLEQLNHFTTSNSKLLSDNIEAIAINDDTGEVYIGTENGLCSYMSDSNSSNEEMTKDNVWAYPNPVKPDYTGLITITGLSLNANIKIVTSNGTLVHQGKSSSGIYQWDGTDLKGKKVASGIYMVMTATEEGAKGVVCKIAIIN